MKVAELRFHFVICDIAYRWVKKRFNYSNKGDKVFWWHKDHFRILLVYIAHQTHSMRLYWPLTRCLWSPHVILTTKSPCNQGEVIFTESWILDYHEYLVSVQSLPQDTINKKFNFFYCRYRENHDKLTKNQDRCLLLQEWMHTPLHWRRRENIQFKNRITF
jgi:hypothetical protein